MKVSSTRKKAREKEFVVEYEYLPTKQSEIRLQQAFEIVFGQLEQILTKEGFLGGRI